MKPIVVATKDQFLRVYNALPHQPAKCSPASGFFSGARLCELISFIPEDFDFDAHMLAVRRSTVEVTAKYHPTGDRFLTREYTKNGEHRRFKIDPAVSDMVREHIALHVIGSGQVVFPVRLFSSTEAAGRDRLTQEEIGALGFTDELPNGRRYKHGTLGGYVTARCRCRGYKQWSADYARDRKRRRTGRSAREWSPAWASVPLHAIPGTPHACIVAHRPGRRPRPGAVPARPRRPSGDHALRLDPRRGRPEGRRRHVLDTRGRCLALENRLSLTRDATSLNR